MWTYMPRMNLTPCLVDFDDLRAHMFTNTHTRDLDLVVRLPHNSFNFLFSP